jgi:ankyrin repeat protein
LRILQWLTFATRPLYLQEVAEIAGMDPDRVSIFDRDEVLEDPNDILSICSSLIVVTEEPQDQHESSLEQGTQHIPIVQLAHYSVKEYLVSQRINKGPAAPYGLEITLCNTQIARCCLQYLLQFEDFDDLHERSLQEFALKSYSAQNWPSHVQDGLQYDQDTKYLCFELFGASKKAFKLWRRLYGCGKIYVKSTHEMGNQYGASRLYFASLFGLPDVVERLLDSGKNPNADREFYGTPPLQAAACNGHVSTARVLIKKGADVHLIGRNNASALSAALSQGLVDMAGFLIDQGADINAYCGYHGFAIQAAIKGGIDAVQLLLERGCDLFAMSENGNALQACAQYGQPEIAKILVEHGAQINGFQGLRERYYGTALQAASGFGNLPMVNFLLAHGADVHEQNEEGKTAIDLASDCAYIDVAERLIEHGTVPTAVAPHFNLDSALCKAIEERNTAVAALMLKHGADPNAISLDDDKGPLENALYEHDLPDCDNARLLLTHGANANSLSALRQNSPFLLAIKARNLGLVKCFIDNGADPNGQDQLIGAPLVIACEGQIDIVRLLFDHGANNLRRGEFGSALAKACGGGHLEIVKLLISKGAFINQHDPGVIVSLHSASRYGHLDVARYLLDRGADISTMVAGLHEAVSVGNMEMTSLLLQHLAAHDAGDTYFGEALSRAVRATCLTPSTVASEKHLYYIGLRSLADVGCAEWTWTKPIDMVQFLIEKGANVNARDNRGGTALLEAKLDLAEMLIEKGADVNAQIDCGTLLEIASRGGKLDIVKLLIEKGAHVEDSHGEFGSALIAASCSFEDNPGIVNVLLQSGANIDKQHPLYGSAISAACKRGHLQVVKLLVERGASINNIVEAHGSALRAVLQSSFVEARQAGDDGLFLIKRKFSGVIELLMQRGATFGSDSDVVDIVLQAAMSNDHYIMKMLIEGSTYSRVVSDEIFNVILWIASCCGQKNMIQLLFSVERNVHSQGFEVGKYERYSLALKSALSQHHLNIAYFLIREGANFHSLYPQWKSWVWIAAANGDFEVLKFLVERGADLEPAAGPYSDAMVVASANGHGAIADFLIEKGADVDALEQGWTALSAASSRGRYKLVKLLISKGANVNAKTEEIGTALQAASAEDHHNVVRLLISKGANINAADNRFESALCVAVCRKDSDLIDLLLRRNAGINIQGGKYGNALQAALVNCNYHIARRLIANGADINAQGGQFGNALQATLSASHSGCDAQRNMAIFLIENGANLNAQGGEHGCALLAALSNSHYYIAELLIREGVDVNVRAGVIDNARLAKLSPIHRYQRGHSRSEEFLTPKIAHLAIDNNAAVAALMGGFPDTARKLLIHRETSFVVSATEYRDILILAVIHGNFSLVITLLDHAEENTLPDNVVTDLFLMAITWGRDALAKVLISRGADIDARDKDGHSALHLAVLSTNPFMVKVLVENNADINAWSLEHGTVLQTAILLPSMDYCWDPEVALILSIPFVDYLLMRGADLNLQGCRYGNALQAAVVCCIDKDEGPENEHIPWLVDTLIVKGADINAQGGEYGNALQAALSLGKPGIASFLIRNGAEVHMRGGKNGNMLQAALSGGCHDLAETLIRQGVDTDTNDEFELTLHTALSKGYGSIVDLLLEKHKDFDPTDEELDQALQKAVLEGDVDSVRLWARLIVRCSEPSIRQRKLNDAVTAALARGHHDIFEFLVQQGAKIDLESFRRYADV